MPTKRIFDLVLWVALLAHPAVGLVKLEGRRLAREASGAVQTLGEAVTVAL